MSDSISNAGPEPSAPHRAHSLVSPGFGRERRKHTFGFGQLLGQ
jgi:hypothetical protein